MSGRASASPLLLAGLELGGTKCSCLIGTGPQDVRMHATVPTGSDPVATFAQIEAELRHGIEAHGPIHALGIASFGPIDRRRTSPHYGWITSTPKPGWRDTAVVPRLAHLGVPVGFDTDVNGAALAEGRWGAARGLEDFAYVASACSRMVPSCMDFFIQSSGTSAWPAARGIPGPVHAASMGIAWKGSRPDRPSPHVPARLRIRSPRPMRSGTTSFMRSPSSCIPWFWRQPRDEYCSAAA